MEPPSPGAPGMFSLADTERLEALLREAGFESVAIEDVPVRFRYDDFAEYWQVTQELGGGIADALAPLSDEDRESVRAGRRARHGVLPHGGRARVPRPLPQRDRLVTYSIVARDPETGELGVAVQTRRVRGRQRRAVGVAEGRRGRDPVVHRPELRPAGARAAPHRTRARGRARRSRSRRSPAGRAPGRRRRRAGARGRPHGRAVHPGGRPHHRATASRCRRT